MYLFLWKFLLFYVCSGFLREVSIRMASNFFSFLNNRCKTKEKILENFAVKNIRFSMEKRKNIDGLLIFYIVIIFFDTDNIIQSQLTLNIFFRLYLFILIFFWNKSLFFDWSLQLSWQLFWLDIVYFFLWLFY